MTGFEIDVRVQRRPRRGSRFELRARLETGDEIAVVFGESGAGKSSLLLALLGALRPEEGTIRLDGRTLFDSAAGIDVPTRERRIGMVFQDSLLFPHLDAGDNVAFGVRGADRRGTARELLSRVDASDLAERRPDELSGGQRQRVALARALAARPDALLLDEPFSALDAAARESLGELLPRLQKESGIPFLHVTHDLSEALRVGTRLVLIGEGRVVQAGAPADVIAHPASLAAARAVGTENLFHGTVIGHDADAGLTELDLAGTRVRVALLDRPAGSDLAVGLRAEDILLSLEPIERTSARNLIPGTVEAVAPHGPAIELHVTTPTPFRVIVTPSSVRELELRPGRRVWLLIKAAAFKRIV
jgi:molybdate transport system ATP-binding protein